MIRKLLFFFLVLASFLAIPSHVQAQTNISGSLSDVMGNPMSANTFVRFRLQNFSGNQPKISTTATLAKIQFDCNTQSVGCSISNLGVLSGVIDGNDVILPVGTYYTVEVWNNGVAISSANYLITGSSWNLNTATPIVSFPVQAPNASVVILPQGGQNIIQPSNTFLQVNGNDIGIFSGTMTPGDCLAAGPTPPFIVDAGTGPCGSGSGGNILPTNNTFTGTNQFASSTFFTGQPSFLGPAPWIDITSPPYNGRLVSNSAIPSTTATISLGSPTHITLVSLPANPFQNGDGIVVRGAGTAFSLATPSAPTVTPSIAAGSMMAGRNVAYSAGASTYNYCIVAVDFHEGTSPCSATGSTSAGATTLGPTGTPVSATSLTRTNNVIAVVAASSFPTTVGAIIYINSPNDATMAGFFRVTSSTDSTHFSITQGNDTRAGASSAAISGATLQSVLGNQLSWTAVSGAYQYIVYGNTGGTLNFISLVPPGKTTYTDYGSTMTANTARPDWVPSTNPASAQNDDFSAQIVSGAGTTNLVVNASALTAVSGATIKFDIGPALLAASNAATTNGTAGTLNLTAQSVPSGAYILNSHAVIPCNYINQAAEVDLYSTLDVIGACNWMGIGGSSAGNPIFGWASAPVILVETAYPGINFTNFAIRHLTFESKTNGLILMLNGNVTFNDSIVDSSFNINALNSGVNDFLGIAILGYGVASQHIQRTTFNVTNHTAQTVMTTTTPAILYESNGGNDSGDLYCDECYFNFRGTTLDSTNKILNSILYRNSYVQSLMEPFIAVENAGVMVHLDGFNSDTSTTPVFANWNSVVTLKISDDPYIAFGGVTGDPVYNIVYDVNTSVAIPGQNKDTFKFGTATVRNQNYYGFLAGGANPTGQSSDFSVRGPMHFPAKNALFFDLPAPVLNSPITATSGTSFLGNGTASITATVLGIDGGETSLSNAVLCTTTTGNQICPATIAAPVQGSFGYSFYVGGSAVIGCRAILTLTCNVGGVGQFLDGSSPAPSGTGSGIAGIGYIGSNPTVWAPTYEFIGPISGNQSFIATLVYNGTTNISLTLPGTSGVLCTTSTCGGGGGSQPTNQIVYGTGGSVTSSSSFTFNPSTLTFTIAGTSLGSITLGSSASTAASFIEIDGGNGVSNTLPAYLKLTQSPANAFSTYLYPCNGANIAGQVCASSTVPTNDSTQNLQQNVFRTTTPFVLSTTAIAATSCSAVQTVSAPGVLATDSVSWSAALAYTGTWLTGLRIAQPYVTNNNVNFFVCNDTAGSLTPPSGVGITMSVNVSVSR